MPHLIAGNWKMHGLSADAVALARGVAGGAAGLACELLVCPPFVHIPAVAQALAGSAVGARRAGLPPGEAGRAYRRHLRGRCCAMPGRRWVILGHSERRQDHGENDELVREKARRRSRPG